MLELELVVVWFGFSLLGFGMSWPPGANGADIELHEKLYGKQATSEHAVVKALRKIQYDPTRSSTGFLPPF